MKKNYLILAIDTSCDETSAAITCDDKVLSNVVLSQTEFHREYGGVVPFIAKKKHQEMIDLIIKKALIQASQLSMINYQLSNINAIAVTIGPGLAPALEVGIEKAKQLALKFNKPLIAVNHMEGHLLSSFAKNSRGLGPFSKIKLQFPILGLLVSGGHTQLVLMQNFGQYKLVGETLDDAAGEAFDKVAKMLELGYPGGPIISELAKKGKAIYDLPIPMQYSPDLNFSFSGLKTACFNKIKEIKNSKSRRLQSGSSAVTPGQFTYDFCASFEKTIIEAIIIKLKKAIKIYQPKQIILGGGVISNLPLRKAVRKIAKEFNLPTFIPYSKKLFTDNAAMIGVCAWHQTQRNDFVKEIEKLDRLPNLNFK